MGPGPRPAPDARALDCCLDILRRTDLRDALCQITLETLVITGERDRLTHPGAGGFVARTMPRARLQQIAGAGHAPFVSHLSQVRDELGTFLAVLQGSPASPAQAAG